MSSRIVGVAVLVAVGAGCTAPVGVKRVDAARVHHRLTANVLSAGAPSTGSTEVLQLSGLTELHRENPAAALLELREWLDDDPNGYVLFALAELWFDLATRSGWETHYLTAALYAYAFLFPEDDPPPADPFDSRIRLAADLYNRALPSAFLSEDGSEMVPAGGHYALPFGTIQVDFDPAQLQYGELTLGDLVPAAELEVRGLRNRYRDQGIGAPLTASLSSSQEGGISDLLPSNARIAVTAMLRIPEPRRSLREGIVRGELELLVEGSSIEIGGREVPLELEHTASLAHTLTESRAWDFELQGFFNPGDSAAGGLYLAEPYQAGRVPIVFVHGTASSVGRWAEMINDLGASPFIREHYQVWFFTYNTSNPIAYSAGRLRSGLVNAVERLDPDERDPALRKIVIIGHSQGGLLAKLTAVDSGDVLWELAGLRPIEEIDDIEPELLEVLEQSLLYEPLPVVSRVIFIATPHRGSFVASFRMARFASGLVRTPRELIEAVRAVDRHQVAAVDDLGASVDTSVSDMNPSSDFIQAISGLEISEDVRRHSIIAVKDDAPLESADDGVVTYQSAHLEDVDSEVVIRGDHSCQDDPETIFEVYRILYEHAGGGREGP